MRQDLLQRPLLLKQMGADGFFSGYASVFDHPDSQAEAVAPGAFQRSLQHWRQQQRMPAMLWMHDAARPIGVWQDISEDGLGLAVRGQLALRTQVGADAYELLRLGAVTGLSIGYRPVASQIDARRRTRLLTEVELFEISLVTFPANDRARIGTVKEWAEGDPLRAVVARLEATARLLREHP